MFKQIIHQAIIGALMPKSKNHGKAREALGISRDGKPIDPYDYKYAATGFPVDHATKIVPPPNMSRPEIEQIMHDAVAAGIDVTANPDGSQRVGIKAHEFIMPPVTPRERGAMITPTELSPEYHAGLASRMVERLDADAARLADALEAEQKQHDTLMAALRAELAGVRKVREAYGHVSVILTPVEPAPADAGFAVSPEIIKDTGRRKARLTVHHEPKKPRPSRPGRRETFEIPPGHEAVLDAEGRATGETRPIVKPE